MKQLFQISYEKRRVCLLIWRDMSTILEEVTILINHTFSLVQPRSQPPHYGLVVMVTPWAGHTWTLRVLKVPHE